MTSKPLAAAAAGLTLDPLVRRRAWGRIALFTGAYFGLAALLGVGCHFLAKSMAAALAARLAAEAPAAGAAAPGGLAPSGSAAPGGESAQMAPAFQLARLGGGQLDLATYRGQVVVLDFWASWCGPCRQQAEILEELHAELAQDRRVQFLAINVGESPKLVQTYQQRSPFPYPVALDTTQRVAAAYGAEGLPTLVVIDPAGKVVLHHIGVLNRQRLRSVIQEALGNSA